MKQVHYHTPQKIKKLINQIEINYKSNLWRVNLQIEKDTLFIASILVSILQIYNKENLKFKLLKALDNSFELEKISNKDKELKEIIDSFLSENLKKNLDIVLLKQLISVII